MNRDMIKKENQMIIDTYFFEHLLSCMYKLIIYTTIFEFNREDQIAINDAWYAGMILLNEARKDY
jgi:hypothetical protein